MRPLSPNYSFTHVCRMHMWFAREKTFGFGARRMFMQPRIDLDVDVGLEEA